MAIEELAPDLNFDRVIVEVDEVGNHLWATHRPLVLDCEQWELVGVAFEYLCLIDQKRNKLLMEHAVASTDLVLSSEVESLVTDVQDRGALIVIQDFPVVACDDGHIHLVVGGEDLQVVLLLLPNLDGELYHVVGIV